LIESVRTAWPAPKGKKVHVHRQVARHSKASGSHEACHGNEEGLRAAMAFVFCAEEAVVISHKSCSASAAIVKGKDDSTDQAELKHHSVDDLRLDRLDSICGLQLPPFEYANLGLLLPAAVAAHGGLLPSSGAACACLPIMAPFQIPQVSPDSWMANKRARAFHRCCVLGVYTQGALALLKFSGGDLVGGTYMGLQAAMGAYAVTPDGSRLMPSYMMVSGFNGLLGIIQVFQAFQGVPLHYIPYSAILPPALSLLTCYWGWEYCQELRAIGAGANGAGPQDTCWVKFMGGDIWPISSLSPSVESTGRRRDSDDSGLGTSTNRFTAFQGSGHQLGAH